MTEFPYKQHSDRDLLDIPLYETEFKHTQRTPEDWFNIAHELAIRLETALVMNDIIPALYDKEQNEEHF